MTPKEQNTLILEAKTEAELRYVIEVIKAEREREDRYFLALCSGIATVVLCFIGFIIWLAVTP